MVLGALERDWLVALRIWRPARLMETCCWAAASPAAASTESVALKIRMILSCSRAGPGIAAERTAGHQAYRAASSGQHPFGCSRSKFGAEGGAPRARSTNCTQNQRASFETA